MAITLLQHFCHRSQRKNEPPHVVKITLQSKNGVAEVRNSLCSCKAKYVCMRYLVNLIKIVNIYLNDRGLDKTVYRVYSLYINLF